VTRLSVPKDRIRIVLFEGIHASAVDTFRANGYSNISSVAASPDADTLSVLAGDAHIIGIRSRTDLNATALAHLQRLLCVGCFCIGTNQVDLLDAERRGVPVFNAPHSNTRSVAELVIGEMIMLMRRIPEKSALVQAGQWQKSATGAHEIRGKTIGIVGYGHIGSQVSVLAEALGMRVLFVDILNVLALGNAETSHSLDALLAASDVVSLHVPSTPATRSMIGEAELGRMRPGSVLINAARGDVVDVEALAKAIGSGHIGGAAVDVFPSEPGAIGNERFTTPLHGLPNVILTPHVGGSTEEAQESIGREVATKIVRYSDTGATVGAVNFPEVQLPVQHQATRFLHVHKNVPGVIAHINDVFSSRGLNIAAQYLRTDTEIGYVVSDIDARIAEGAGVRRALEAVEGTLRVRFLY